MDKDIAAFTFVFSIPEALVFSLFAILHGFLTDLCNGSEILWLFDRGELKKSKELIICRGKQEQARTCSIYINAQDNHSKFTVVT